MKSLYHPTRNGDLFAIETKGAGQEVVFTSDSLQGDDINPQFGTTTTVRIKDSKNSFTFATTGL